MNTQTKKIAKVAVVPIAVAVPFILITICFPLWGFANDITNPMVSSFKTILLMQNWQSALIQMAFYGGYFAMAFPAAMFIQKYSYKSGIIMGLGLYALGGLLFIPSSYLGMFSPFLIAYFTLTCGLSFLETSANPYIMSMGDESTATRRLNLAQAFNPLGSLLGMYTAQQFILEKLNIETYEQRADLLVNNPDNFNQIMMEDLAVVRNPYVAIGAFILVFILVIAFSKMPNSTDHVKVSIKDALKRLLKSRRYTSGVIAQFFYVGAQILCWTYIIQYGESIGLTKSEAQGYNIIAMILFVSNRFIATFLMKYISAGKLLSLFGLGAVVLTLGVIFLPGMIGLYSLVGVSAFMSLMFPTIYGIALKGVGEDAKFGAAGLIKAILGGSVLPPIQAAIFDLGGPGYNDIKILGVSEVKFSFILPLICLAVVTWYGYKTFTKYDLISDNE